MKAFVFLTFVTVAFSIAYAAGAFRTRSSGKTEWTYGGGATSPFNWANMFPEYCSGKRQSPINIDAQQATQVQFDFLRLKGFHFENGAIMTVTNNGHTVKLAIEGEFFVSGGGLPGEKYKVEQLHFHWGKPDAGGSEHTVNGKRYDAEMHLVTYDASYTDFATARTHVDGLAVFAVFIQIGRNPSFHGSPLDVFLHALPMVENKGQSHTFPASQLTPLIGFLPDNIDWFYRYRGSLTTPSCDERVIWTVFEQPIILPINKMSKLYDLYGNDKIQILDNYRPLQSVNGREIFYSHRND